ncbi:MAG TPA: hypothetical protein VFX18_04095 [Candidatus Nitrosocosmicus sp.]|nr:hypothetical protein [Candidatus Nitrosocosmicus sp.]
MKSSSLLLISVISVFLIPVIQNANAQDNNPLTSMFGSLKNSIGNLTSGAGKSANQTASQAGQSANQTASQAGQSTSNSSNSSNIQSNAASYPGNIANTGNNNVSKNNPIGGQIQNLTKGVTNTLGKILNGK